MRRSSRTKRGRTRCRFLCLRLHDGRITVFYLRKNSDEDCIPFCAIPPTKPKLRPSRFAPFPENGYFVLNDHRVTLLRGGRLLTPVALDTDNSGHPA